MRLTRDQWAIQMAFVTAKRSTCCRRAVGCVLLNKRGHIISTGYNGVASGLPHCNEVTEVVQNLIPQPGRTHRHPEYWGKQAVEKYGNVCEGHTALSGTNLDGCMAIHAEQNALLQCKDIHDIDTAYVTTSPCVTCTKLLLNTSCNRIVFLETYTHSQSEKIWIEAGRQWVNHLPCTPL
jgi:dCMP deaminase